MSALKKIVAGNWKMFGMQASVEQVLQLKNLLRERGANCDVVLCPPFTLLSLFSQSAGGAIAIGSQDCHNAVEGAFTGNISAQMIVDAGASVVIVGHSERRVMQGESDALVQQKASAAILANLKPIICVGETLEQRQSGEHLDVVGAQLLGSLPQSFGAQGLVVAYEPVWAIGTGKIPTLEDIGQMHDHIRGILSQKYGAQSANSIHILYGGSVKPNNAKDIFAVRNVDGALVGGASLKASDFSEIIYAC